MALLVDIEKKMGNFHLKAAFQTDSSGIFGLLGESGCGKSMTLKCIAGIEMPDRGRIVFNDRVFFDSEKRINLAPQKRNVGYLFQDYALFPNLTVKQNIGIVLKNKDSVEEYIRQFYLGGLEDHYPFMLSGGQQQRCALARMMASEPELLLLDEPFSAVDKNLRWKLELQLLELLDQTRKPVIFVSHNKAEIDHLCQTVGILDKGQIVETGKKEEIFAAPKTEATARLIGCQNIYDVGLDDTSQVGIPQEAVHIAKEGEEAQITGYVERILGEEQMDILLIRMKCTIFYYQIGKKDHHFSIGDQIRLHVDESKVWHLTDENAFPIFSDLC